MLLPLDSHKSGLCSLNICTNDDSAHSVLDSVGMGVRPLGSPWGLYL